MAKIKKNNTTILGITATLDVENQNMLPRFLKEFRHPTHLKIRTFEHFKCVLLSDILSFHFNPKLMEDYDTFMDLSELYPEHVDSSYLLDTYVVEVLGDKSFKIDVPLLGEIKIKNLTIDLPV